MRIHGEEGTPLRVSGIWRKQQLITCCRQLSTETFLFCQVFKVLPYVLSLWYSFLISGAWDEALGVLRGVILVCDKIEDMKMSETFVASSFAKGWGGARACSFLWNHPDASGRDGKVCWSVLCWNQGSLDFSLTFSPPFSCLSSIACLSTSESWSISRQNAVVLGSGVKELKF